MSEAREREKPDPRLVNIAAQGIRIANARGAAECAEAALAALESAGWRIVKLEQVGEFIESDDESNPLPLYRIRTEGDKP